MILITGGAWQGKEEFGRGLLRERCGGADLTVADGETASMEEMERAQLVTNIHMWTKRLLREEKDVCAMAVQLAEKNPDAVLTVNELGCGVVPVEAFDRNWRELTGRACCELAKRAEAVYRVTCGIAVRIK